MILNCRTQKLVSRIQSTSISRQRSLIATGLLLAIFLVIFGAAVSDGLRNWQRVLVLDAAAGVQR